ncbi:FecR family protein [Chitinophaga skermanii]|uniref:FecR family protein n=1 Tax=Chitinophaga skermanii TaxID=331697 RepID=A0A327QX78_9BACT|nr:FecR domain-containing protein [Chitinophaga skermanii]RAJ08334.1 FecR family protein [Chitinophaga skermanii]
MDNVTVEWLIAQPSFINYCLREHEQDVHSWRQWLQAHPEHADIFNEAEDIVKSTGWLLVAEKEKAGAMALMDDYLRTSKPRSRNKQLYWWSTAAAAAVIAVLVIVKWPTKQSNIPTTVASAPLQLHYSADGSTRKSILLPDSTYVLLDKHSTLDIDAGYNTQNRHVVLNGTGYFKIKSQANLPFDVKGGDYTVTALGTAFKMTVTPGHVHVMLEQGKVKVEQGVNEHRKLLTYLLPMESYNSAINHHQSKAQVFEQTALALWKTEEIIFEHTPLEEVVAQLESCYNVDINIEGVDLKKETFSGKFRNDSLQSVLNVLCFAVNKQYQFTDATSVLIK